MPNNNVLIGWSHHGYMSEHTMDGEMIMEASFLSSRFATYRAFKSNFTGLPLDQPAIKSVAVQPDGDPTYTITISYVSWNGATDIKGWRFFGSRNASSDFEYLGQAPRTGFETSFSERGEWEFVYAEAIAKDGSILGTSEVHATGALPGAAAYKDKLGLPKVDFKYTRPIGLSKGAIAAGSAIIVLGLQMVALAIYMILKYLRGTGPNSRQSFAEDQVQLLSTKEQD
jgi:hypothetical protein